MTRKVAPILVIGTLRITISAIVAEWMNLDRIGNKLVYGFSEAEWCPETHNKMYESTPWENFFISKNSKWPPRY